MPAGHCFTISQQLRDIYEIAADEMQTNYLSVIRLNEKFLRCSLNKMNPPS